MQRQKTPPPLRQDGHSVLSAQVHDSDAARPHPDRPPASVPESDPQARMILNVLPASRKGSPTPQGRPSSPPGRPTPATDTAQARTTPCCSGGRAPLALTCRGSARAVFFDRAPVSPPGRAPGMA